MDSLRSHLERIIWSLISNSRLDATKSSASPALLPSEKNDTASSHEKKIIQNIVFSTEDLKFINPIRYAYDPVVAAPSYLNPVPLSFPLKASKPCPQLRKNSVRVHPLRGGLPYRSSLNHVRSCKHFAANILESTELLEKIMTERSAADVPVGAAGITLGKLAKHELRPGIADRMSLAATYMFPAADEKRIRIIAVLMIMYFIFDGQ